MSSLILTLVRDAVSLFVQAQAAKRSVQRGIGTIVFYGVVAAFGLAALIFFYIGLYRVVADATTPEAAAAILCAGNLVVIGLLLLGRSIMQRREPPRRPAGDVDDLIDALPDFETLLSLGQRFEKNIRKAAPKLTLASAIIGIIVGVRPELLSIFTGQAPRPKRERSRRRR